MGCNDPVILQANMPTTGSGPYTLTHCPALQPFHQFSLLLTSCRLPAATCCLPCHQLLRQIQHCVTVPSPLTCHLLPIAYTYIPYLPCPLFCTALLEFCPITPTFLMPRPHTHTHTCMPAILPPSVYHCPTRNSQTSILQCLAPMVTGLPTALGYRCLSLPIPHTPHLQVWRWRFSADSYLPACMPAAFLPASLYRHATHSATLDLTWRWRPAPSVPAHIPYLCCQSPMPPPTQCPPPSYLALPICLCLPMH